LNVILTYCHKLVIQYVLIFTLNSFFKEILVQDHFFRKYSVNHTSILNWIFMSSTSDDEIWNYLFHFQVQEEIEREVHKYLLVFYQPNDILSPTLFSKRCINKRFDDRAIIFKTHLLRKVTFDNLIKDFLWLLFLLSEEVHTTSFKTTVSNILKMYCFTFPLLSPLYSLHSTPSNGSTFLLACLLML